MGKKLKEKLFQGKCFVEQGIEKGNIPKTLPRPREEIVIGFPLHTARGEKLKKKASKGNVKDIKMDVTKNSAQEAIEISLDHTGSEKNSVNSRKKYHLGQM